MYENVFPSITGPEIATEFRQYEAFKAAIRDVKNSMKRYEMRSDRMPLDLRGNKILKLEAAQCMLFDYAMRLQAFFSNAEERTNVKTINKLIVKLAEQSPIRVDVNANGDWIINTPLLGINQSIVSQLKHKIVQFAVRALEIRGKQLPQIQKGCVLVKISGDISKMAHRTLENREIHAVTDAFMSVNKTDDNPANFSFMYAWAYSSTPGIQIIICPEERAHLYKSIMMDFGDPGTLAAENVDSWNRKLKAQTALDGIESILKMYPRLVLGPKVISAKQIDCLTAIMRRLTSLNSSLRNPSIYPKGHQSQYYSKGSEPKDKEYVALFDPTSHARFEYDEEKAALISYSEKLDSIYIRSGKVLQDYLYAGFSQFAAWYATDILAAVKSNTPMAITIERVITNGTEPDGDNINVLGASFQITQAASAVYDFSDHIMLIKSKILQKPGSQFEEYPTKIILSKAEDVSMDFYR